MNGIVLAPMHNSTSGPHTSDATGAFQPGARAFAAALSLPAPSLFDNTRPPAERRKAVLEIVRRTPPPLGVLAIFSHGWRTGTQWGGDIASADEIGATIASVAAPDVVIALYACSTGEDVGEAGHPGVHASQPGAGDGGFADALRDAVLAHGKRPRVIAHGTVGHAYLNPYVRIFDASTTRGGEWLIAPGSPEWRPWGNWLRRGGWTRFPFMTREQIVAELHAP